MKFVKVLHHIRFENDRIEKLVNAMGVGIQIQRFEASGTPAFAANA